MSHVAKTDNQPVLAGGAILDVGNGESIALHVAHLEKRIGDTVHSMLAYNGSIPGPTLRVVQGAEIFVTVTNDTETDTTVHWHGIRLENSFDGVPYATQAPIHPGGSFTHRLTFPDAGLYWYHPHMREDYAQELGLYGNILVEPADKQYWPPADRSIVWTLDDILIEDGAIAPFASEANFAAMGRFGNVLLIGGETTQRVHVRHGEVVRILLTNTANTRVFNVAIPGARMKLIGGDSGRVEHESWVTHVIIAPSERAIVDVRFDEPGAFELQHVTPDRTYTLAEVQVARADDTTAAGRAFDQLRISDEMALERERVNSHLETEPDKTLALVAVMDVDEPDATAAVVYACPMHPEIVRDEPGKCPLCGMKLLPTARTAATAAPGQHHHHEDPALSDGIEWEDLMLETNRATTTSNMHWKLVDRETGAANDAIDWTFEAGEQVKIRLVNEMESDHPMHHPFHVHGERFLVLARDGRPEPNLVWKDTVLIRTGETVDILLDASNPGTWMAHCHIAEHLETGMMFSFHVRESRP